MKLSIVFLLITTLQVMATGYAQNLSLNLSMNNTSMRELFKEIERQTELSFLFSDDISTLDNEVSINVSEKNIEDVLNQLFTGTNLGYQILNEKLIVIAPRANLQQITVTGTVIDMTGDPLPGVNIIIKGTTQGVSTDQNGAYSLPVPNGNVTLIFSYIGYVTQEVGVAGRTVVNVTLNEDSQLLEEIVVIGYGTTTVRDLTSSISSVKSDDLDRTAMASIDNMLQGRLAGLNMSLNSAQPGGAININIRGAISPNGNNEPLYVIDGVPMTSNTSNIASTLGGGIGGIVTNLEQSPLNTINPADILSIDVLKDASAAAIYGSASANGVIIITTRRGQEGTPKLNYSGSYTQQVQKPYKQKLMDTPTYMAEYNRWAAERAIFDRNTYPYGNVDYNGDGFVDEKDYYDLRSTIPDFYSATEIANAPNTNWLDFVTDNAFITEHNISLNGGTSGTKYYVSYNYYLNDGILKNSDMERNTLRFNLDQKLGKRINLGVNVTYALINTTNQSWGTSPEPSNATISLIQIAYMSPPWLLPEIDPSTGSYYKYHDQVTNPAGALHIMDKNKNQRIFVNPTISIDIMKGLTFKAVGGFDSQVSRRDYFVPTTVGSYLIRDGMATIANNESQNKSLEGYFNYDTKFGEHRISAVVGLGGYFSDMRNAILQSFDFWTDAFATDNVSIGSSAEKRYVGSSRSEMKKRSQFARLNYSLTDKYLLTLTGRRDGSSIFAANKKWGFFPSVSGAWRISEEAFMEGTKSWLSNLKLRVGYGSSGNEPRRANSLAVFATNAPTRASAPVNYGLMTAGGYLPGIQLSTAANPNLSWETNETLNFGLDFGLKNQRITGTIEYFIRTAKDLLDYRTLPHNQPITRVIDNIGSTQAKGLEFEFSSINVRRSNFTFTTNLNMSYSIYRWKERNPELVLDSWESPTDEMSAIFGMNTDGIFKSFDEVHAHTNSKGEMLQPQARPGTIKYLDYNGDGVLNDADNHFLGRRMAPFQFGLTNSLSYKSFIFSFMFYGSAGNSVSDGGRGVALAGTQTQYVNSYDTGIDRIWSMWNQDGDWTGIAIDRGMQQARTGGSNDYNLKKMYFAKLGSIELGYILPRSFVSKFNIRSATVSLNARNLATITNYVGYDPEIRGNYPYPITTALTVGLKLEF